MQSMIRYGIFPKYAFSTIQVKLKSYQTHRIDAELLPKTAETNGEELMTYFKSMTLARRMEIACDGLYKQRLIRGFLHLADGQEAVYEGIHRATNFDDCIITAYRCHCVALLRGDSVRKIMAEMMAKKTGSSHGKGGSMHFYNKKTNFYGGNGIVGAQIPVGTGLAFGQKYLNKPNCSFILFGDGAANQGQLYEAANMAYLWKLPAIYFIENNLFGMGTSVERASANPKFYMRGDVIPGIQIDGNNIFQVREICKFAKDYVIKNGPLFLEVLTYRYHGHSMSDPGLTYRTREDVQKQRKTRDCINYIKKLIVENNVATEEQLEDIDDEIKDQVEQETQQAKDDPFPSEEDLTSDIYVDNDKHFIRGIEFSQSQFVNGVKL